ncbi:MAG: HAD-IA family hydrolase [Methylophilaceae bacterium]
MKSKQFDLIIFDWDGTLANSTQLIVNAIRAASLEVGLPDPGQEAASSIIGLGLREALVSLFGQDIPSEQIQQMAARYNFHYNIGENNIPLFDGVLESIQTLDANGFKLAVATGKGRNGLNRALQNSGLGKHFGATRCVDECYSKPHPQMILELMDELDAKPERTLMVGDTSFDLQMASNANVASLGVSYGAHPLSNLLPHKPLAHFDAFSKLNQWLVMNA